jgi:tetratricopeptide (TPR) repeat protein
MFKDEQMKFFKTVILCIIFSTLLLPCGACKKEKNIDEHYTFGKTLFDKKDYKTAITEFNKTIELNPKHEKAYNIRGAIYFEIGEYSKALVDYNNAIEINPKYSKAYSNRGNVYYEMVQYDKAITDYLKAIESNSNNSDAINNLAWLYVTALDAQYRNPTKGLELALKANSMNKYPEFIDTLAASYARNDNFELAVNTEKEAIAIAINDRMKYTFIQRAKLYSQEKYYP